MWPQTLHYLSSEKSCFNRGFLDKDSTSSTKKEKRHAYKPAAKNENYND